VAEGDTAIDLGCGPGYFTLPLARLVGRSGSVIAIDLQPKMLALLDERARRAGLAARIRTYACSATTLGVVATADFALAVCMVHEVPDAASFLREVHGLLRPGGRLLLVEPRIHVTADGFERTITLTQKAGFRLLSRPRRAFSRAALFERLS
jgi:ubiquinone/menaquinone biosynthesis C-methylase UbiE